MTTSSTPCVAGCTIRGQHVTEHEDATTCRGCVPRGAEYGRLCAWCWQRLNSDVATAPALVRHLRDVAVPHAGVKPPSDDRGYRDPAEGSVLSGAVSDADDLHALLATWAALYVEDHPGARGPDERHAWRSRQVLVPDPGFESYVVRSKVVGIRDPEGTTDLVRWLLPQLEWLARQEWAGEARRELGRQTALIKARWPIEDLAPRPVEGVPCPRCDRLSLTYTPPAWFRMPFKVACQNPECGRPFSEDEWERLVALTIGHRATSSDPTPYVRPPAPSRRRPVRSGGFRGMSLDDVGPACPVCHLVQPCDCQGER